MNRSLLLIALIGFLACALHPLHAEPPKIEHVIATLHAAKEAKEPLPLLQKAREELASFKPAGNTIAVGPRKAAAIKAASRDDKQDAMEAIAAAIKVAKESGDVKPKIDHAIALVHKTGDAKN